MLDGHPWPAHLLYQMGLLLPPLVPRSLCINCDLRLLKIQKAPLVKENRSLT